MSGANDLANLFGPPAAPDPFRQGTVLTFNAATGANTVNVGGAVLTNLPVLVGGDTVNLGPGDAVIVLKYQQSWAILGRIVVPGSEDLTAAAVAFGGAGSSVLGGWRPTTVATAVLSNTVDVPVWADEALVLGTATSTVNNNSGGDDVVFASVGIAGVGGGENFTFIPSGRFGLVTSHAHRSDLAVTPGGTFTIEARIRSGSGSWSNHGSNICNLDAIVVFRKAS